MKFINKLLLWQRFTLIGILALTLGGVPFYMYFIEAQKALDFARDEQRGVMPLRLIISLYKSVQDDRGLAVQLLSGVKTVVEDRAAKQAEIDQLARAIDTLATQDHWPTTHFEYWKAVKADLELISTTIAQRSVSAMETRQHHHHAIADIHILREDIVEYYRLSLDPAPVSSQMVRSVVYDMFRLLDPIGLLRGSGADVLFRTGQAQPADTATKVATDAERVKLIQLVSEAHLGLETFSTSVKNIITDDPNLQQVLDPSLQQAVRATLAIINLTDNEIIHAPIITYNFIDYRKTASNAVKAINNLNATILAELNNILHHRVANLERERAAILSLFFMLSILGALLSFLIMRSVLKPVDHLVGVMHQIAGGNFNARAAIDSQDEIGQLARHFNQMVDERETVTTRIRIENEQLNTSVIILLQAVARLSQRDLTVQIPVANDLTGPLSDALNMLTSEMAKALRQIGYISEGVTQAALSVQEQADLVSSVAKSEREEVEKTAIELDHAALTMLRIAQLAQSTNIAADKATQTTQNALETVGATIEGIEHTRETIREAGDRIERLGIHSHEISSVVDLIGGIARRTQILAVSASMHAASAGEAGLGFQVIANEVQRLAETAQQAAAKIGTLLANIQGEVTDTVTTMHNVVKQVIEGSRLAEQAGEQMRLTQRTTADLVTSVQTIAESSEEQAQASSNLLNRAHSIRKSTQLTSKQLKSQTTQTENLVKYAHNLLSVIQIFKLPT